MCPVSVHQERYCCSRFSRILVFRPFSDPYPCFSETSQHKEQVGEQDWGCWPKEDAHGSHTGSPGSARRKNQQNSRFLGEQAERLSMKHISVNDIQTLFLLKLFIFVVFFVCFCGIGLTTKFQKWKYLLNAKVWPNFKTICLSRHITKTNDWNYLKLCV